MMEKVIEEKFRYLCFDLFSSVYHRLKSTNGSGSDKRSGGASSTTRKVNRNSGPTFDAERVVNQFYLRFVFLLVTRFHNKVHANVISWKQIEDF